MGTVSISYKPVKFHCDEHNTERWGVGIVIDGRYPAILYSQGKPISLKTEDKCQDYINEEYYYEDEPIED